MFAAIQAMKTNLLRTLQQPQQSGFCFACASVVGVDDEWFCCIVCAPLVIQWEMTLFRVEGGGRGILAHPLMLILRFQNQVDRRHTSNSFLRNDIHPKAHTSRQVNLLAGSALAVPEIAREMAPTEQRSRIDIID